MGRLQIAFVLGLLVGVGSCGKKEDPTTENLQIAVRAGVVHLSWLIVPRLCEIESETVERASASSANSFTTLGKAGIAPEDSVPDEGGNSRYRNTFDDDTAVANQSYLYRVTTNFTCALREQVHASWAVSAYFTTPDDLPPGRTDAGMPIPPRDGGEDAPGADAAADRAADAGASPDIAARPDGPADQAGGSGNRLCAAGAECLNYSACPRMPPAVNGPCTALTMYCHYCPDPANVTVVDRYVCEADHWTLVPALSCM